jgi:hypothetical protein
MVRFGLRRHAALVLVAAAYLCAWPYFERINNPNENVRIWATRAIVEHHVLNIDAVEREWGYVNDKAKNGAHVYSSKAPGVTFLGVPVLAADTLLRRLCGAPPPGKRESTFWLRLCAVKLPMCAFLWAFASYVARTTRSALARDVLVIALGLGTLLFPYGGLFVGHALAAAAAFGAYMLLRPPEEHARATARGIAGAGALAGAAVVLEYQAILVGAALAVFAVIRYRRRALAFVAGAAPLAVALGAYHTALFGRPWSFPYANLENPTFAAVHHSAGFHGLSWPHAAAFPSLLISPSYGLFAFSPVLLVGLVAAAASMAHGARRDGGLVLVVCAAMFSFNAGMTNWRAGWCVGPRYIATVAPFLLLPIVRGWRWFAARWWRSASLVGLVVVSVFLNVVSGAVYPHYPEAFDNPVFDLALPLVADGYAPYGIGWAVGLRGGAALAPLAAVVLAALALILPGDDPEPRRAAEHFAVAIVVAVAVLLPQSAYGRAPRGDEARAAATVRALWEPVPAAGNRP